MVDVVAADEALIEPAAAEDPDVDAAVDDAAVDDAAVDDAAVDDAALDATSLDSEVLGAPVEVGAAPGTAQPASKTARPSDVQFDEYVAPFHVKGGMMSPHAGCFG